MRRALFAILVVLVVAQAVGCRTSEKDETDTQRSEHHISQDV
jgi:hypothetical protein